jgi:polysaccharide export outer membrane protein
MSMLLLASIVPCIAFQVSFTTPTANQADTRGQNSLPFQKLGPDDLIRISVYGAPEMSGEFRIDSNGQIQLPIIKNGIKVSGIFPTDAGKVIADALKNANILVNPLVSVAVAEYRSRPITVVGAVKKPLTFQATGEVRLLDALSMCEGITESAGPEIIIATAADSTGTQERKLALRIPIKELLNGRNPALNVELQGGEEIRVPEAGKVFVVGNVKKPGAFTVRDKDESSVLRALSISEGLEPYASFTAYIYRVNPSSSDAPAGGRSSNTEIPIDLKKIIDRKAPDVTLQAGDILYVPDRSGRRTFANVMEKVILFGGGVSAAAIYAGIH